MSLARHLAKLGYGTRKEAERLLQARRLTSADGTVLRDGDRFVHEEVRLDGTPLDPPPNSVVLLNKPVGYVCSTSDRPPLVYDLLPSRFLQRTPVMATVGRLDADTSGLLLLTDDGALNHRLTSPRSHVPKTYVATLAERLRGDEAARFASGTMRLQGEETPLLPAQLEVLGEREAALTIREGRYHQVRRMFAATGNHVVALRRTSLGSLLLGALAEGSWRVLDGVEREALVGAARAAKSGPGLTAET
ncbi:pseudouridine synthase [Gemmatimonas phototrophica]|uniref:Pseudouridine synthase n=1 Tax=Gemmatimonas phototrophica TaxID=1379270 RepID=A0A143BJL5_9BACT|nr:pseudouridine synthase [Gemmatimonas phototrophica]AMW05219.1 pseudouridine synthase [Gemmatimonas phototrophica]